ncbi:hypothetical protein PHYSODRAFT_334829 [Phytophthora sojae]|uniref:Uncharacterized protein n=1 Tax=Phytophthora sojae (strain P6497) TaxID=1094619 RepID=G4ZSA4_PHYSP|nr:hypothetical protein PHYSODRAFT_334829 [Phytophthora sojae]EGZ13000.1 hypothetical protein PHYSODRAFT_334829 [Phytophthora sojae]|eukprot:XP_009530429.1 hypothetical protein PHYSODRAFT_334829 [Phytophthora sojae]
MDGKRKATHVEFLKKLHLELIQLKPDDWTQMLRHRGMHPTPSKQRKATTTHVPVPTDEWRKDNTDDTRKRRQRACKVYSVLKRAGEARGGETTFYCGGGKLKTAAKNAHTARVFLCNKVKHTSNGEAVPCLEIWHRHWKNGTVIPPSITKRKIRARKPAATAAAASDGGSSDSDAASDGSARAIQQHKRARRNAM